MHKEVMLRETPWCWLTLLWELKYIFNPLFLLHQDWNTTFPFLIASPYMLLAIMYNAMYLISFSMCRRRKLTCWKITECVLMKMTAVVFWLLPRAEIKKKTIRIVSVAKIVSKCRIRIYLTVLIVFVTSSYESPFNLCRFLSICFPPNSIHNQEFRYGGARAPPRASSPKLRGAATGYQFNDHFVQ